MREGRRRFVPLACVFAVVLAALVVGLCAGAAAPARAAAPPAHSLWWTVLYGPVNTNISQFVDVAEGPDGSLYAGGMYNGTLGDDNGDLLVAKFNASDAATTHMVWTHTWDDPDAHLFDKAEAIAVDRSGAVIAAGITETASNATSWVVAKWSTHGTALWQKTFAASTLVAEYAFAWDVACDHAGNVYVCGMVQTGTSGGHDVTSLVVRKLARTDGHVIWTHAYKGYPDSYNAATRLALDPAGNVYCTGDATSAHGDEDIIACKLRSSDGHQVWARRIAGAKHLDDEGTDIAVRGGGVWVTGGEYTGASTREVVLAKYTLAGKLLWTRTWLEQAKTREYPNAVAVDKHGNAVVVGAGNDDPVTREHAFVLRYSSAGVLSWRRISYDTVSHEAEWIDVVCDAAGNIWVGGDTDTGSSEAFLVARYSASGARPWRSIWKGPDGLAGECDALCFGKTGLFAAGTITTIAGGAGAAAVKFTR